MADGTIEPVRSTGIGSWPGTDLVEAFKIIFEESPEIPYLPELPARGVGSQLLGRGVAVLSGLAVDLQPAGWRLTDAPGRDQLRARATLRDDLDQLEESVQDYRGAFKIAIAGPWTLAASVERPRGDRALADHGLRRDLGQSLAEGIGALVGDLGRRLPQLELIIQLDEPALPAVLAGQIPTASGFSRHRKIDLPEVSETLTGVIRAIESALPQTPEPLPQTPEPLPQTPEPLPQGPELVEGPTPIPRSWLHSCAAGVPVMLIKNAGFGCLAVDLDQLTTGDWDLIGQAMGDGLWLGAGALPTGPGAGSPSADDIARRVLRAVRTLKLDPEVAAQLIITPACGLAGFDRSAAVAALRTIRTAADIVTDQLAG